MTTAMPIRALVAEDEPASRRHLVRLLGRQPGVEIVAECANGREVLDAAARTTPNAVFLDIHMPRMSGFDVVDGIAGADLALVFVTADDGFALRAFDVRALDYVLKPYDDDRIARSIERVRQHLEARHLGRVRLRLGELFGAGDGGVPMPRRAERLAVKIDGRLVFVPIDAVTHIAAEGSYARIHTRRGSHLVRESLSRIVSRLPATRFARVHRSTIANLDAVVSLESLSHGEATLFLTGGISLKVSRNFRGALGSLGVPSRRPSS